jgi:predicted transcriptional regulator
MSQSQSIGSPSLNLESRRRIHELIQSSPMIHFREIQRRLRVATGALSYHLGILIKFGLIGSEISGQMVRFYPTQLADVERRILTVIRHERQRRILLLVMKSPGTTHGEIADALTLPASSTSWYLNKMLTARVLDSETNGRTTRYFVRDADLVTRLIEHYEPALLDKASDNLISAWDSLSKRGNSSSAPNH